MSGQDMFKRIVNIIIGWCMIKFLMNRDYVAKLE